MGTYQSPVLCLLLNRLAVVRLFTSAEDFRQFCQRNPEKGHRSSLHRRKTPKNARRGSEVSHNSFLDPISSAENPNNHGRLQRRRRPASSSGCVRGKFPASNPPLSLRHCAEPPSRRQVQTSRQWKRTAHLLLEDDVFLWLCRLEAISPSIRCHEIEHLLNTGVAFPGRGVAVGYAMKSLLLLPNCPIAHLQLFSLSFRPHAPPSRRPLPPTTTIRPNE